MTAAGMPGEPDRHLGTNTALREELSPYFDAAWFLSRNPDVRDSGLDPLAHYLVQGHLEGRNPSQFFDTAHYRAHHMGADEGCPLVHYVRKGRLEGISPHPMIDPVHIARVHGVPCEHLLSTLIACTHEVDSVSEWFSRRAYAKLYPDVTGEPFEHFVTAGFAEGRPPRPGFMISRDGGGEVVFRHAASGGSPACIVRSALPRVVYDQIIAQGAIDPAVFAAGYEAIPNLPQRRSTSIIDREGLDHRRLLDAIGQRPDVIVLHPALTVGGADRYMAQLVQALDRDLAMKPLVMTTRASDADDRRALDLSILTPLRACRVLSLQPHLATARDPALSLSLLLLALRPTHVLVINSELGLEAITRYGRSLSSAMRLLVSFFSESPVGRGAWYPTRYLHDVISHATVFADNHRILDRLSERLGHQVQGRFALIPQPISVSGDARFAQELAQRRERMGPSPRVLWMSRWRPAKAVDVLEQLATMRPDITIDVYGVDDSANFPPLPNLIRHPVVYEPETLTLQRYDAFIFTSRFEGMPNVVIEMAGRGIPVIASDVGGLRETLDESTVDYIPIDGTAREIACAFGDAIDRVRARHPEETSVRLQRARDAVAGRHSAAAFSARLREVLT